MLQAKVSVFVELFRKTEEVKQQAELLRDLQRRAHEREFAEARQEWEEQSQRDTEAAKKKLMAIFEATPDLIAIVSPAGILQYMSDTGCGMNPEVQSRAFEPFFTTKEEGKGTGLGLATVYGIVKQTGGNIWLYSEVDRGTTFKIYLPRMNDAAETLQANSTGVQETILGSETILLVEDNETVREHTNDILAGAGYNVLIAKDVEDAQRLCRTHQGHIHMMLSDVVMPRMKGPDLAKHCLSMRPEMKVLFVSGYTNASVTDHGIFESGAAFLEKPFAADTLLSKVREVLYNPASNA